MDLESELVNEIGRGETNKLEFKADLPKDHKKYIKTAVAFSNSFGGRILFGVTDDREIIGLPDDTLYSTKDIITDSIYQACNPVIVPDVYCVSVSGKNVLVVEILPGADCPYFIKSEGIEKGTYIRVSGTSMPADLATIRMLQMRGRGYSFDKLACNIVEVKPESLDTLCSKLSSYKLPIDPVKLENMGVITKVGNGYTATNAYALLTSNPFLHARVQCARFLDKEGTVFFDSAEFTGDIVSQVEGAISFTLKQLFKSSEIESLVRKDFYDVPEKAIREAIVNAVVHREYSMEDSSIFVKIYDDHLDVESPGLPLGLDINDLGSGRSKIRNQVIASVFKAIGFIEQYGTGIRRMIKACEEQNLKPPEFIEDKDHLIVRFQRKTLDSRGSSDDEKVVISVIVDNPNITKKEISEMTGISESRIKRIVTKMRKNGLIEYEGNSQNGRWVVMR